MKIQTLLCMIGLHDRKWSEPTRYNITNRHDKLTGFVYLYKATCTACGCTKHKRVEV